MGILKRIRLIPRIDQHFIFDNKRVKSIRGHGDGVGVALHIQRSVLDIDLGVPTNETVLFLTWKDIRLIIEALEISDKETLRLRKGRGWRGIRPYSKRYGLEIDENSRLHEVIG